MSLRRIESPVFGRIDCLFWWTRGRDSIVFRGLVGPYDQRKPAFGAFFVDENEADEDDDEHAIGHPNYQHVQRIRRHRVDLQRPCDQRRVSGVFGEGVWKVVVVVGVVVNGSEEVTLVNPSIALRQVDCGREGGKLD